MKILSRTKTGDPFLDQATATEHLRLDPNVAHPNITFYLDAATSWLEKACDRTLIASDYVVEVEADEIAFTHYPYAEISAVDYVDELGVTVSVLDYSIESGALVAEIPATAQSITVAFSDAPAGDLDPLRQAGYMLAATFYNEPSNVVAYMVSQLPFGVRQLIAPYRSFIK